jgi:hypothetical protein
MYIFNLMVSINKTSKRLGFLCIVFLSISVCSQVPQQGNLVAYYPFSGNVNDSGGNNYNGTLNGGPTLTQDRFGNSNSAYALDGVDGYIYFGNAMYADFPDTNADGDYEDDFSISIWAKSSVTADEAFVAFGESDGLYTGMISRIGANISFNSSNWGFSANTSGKRSDGQWHQYVFVYSAGSFREIFIDGSSVAQSNNPDRRFNFKNYGVSIGKERFTASGTEDPTNPYTGSVDDVRIWNVALTGAEVSNLYDYDNLAPMSAPTITNFNDITKTYFDASYTIAAPTSNSTGAFTYTSDNSAVATISGTSVTIVGAGAATITAAQAGDATYASGSATSILTVSSVSVVTENGEFSTTNFNYVNKNGAIGGGFGVNKNGLSIQTRSNDLITSGLVMHLDAGNAASYPGTGTTWTDLSGLGNNGTLVNNPTYNSSNGGNIVFNGSNTYVNAPLTKTASCTFSVWANSTNTNSGNMLFNAGNNDSGPDLFFSGGKLSWNTWDSSNNPFGSIPATSADGNWHNYVLVNDAVSNTAKLYYDGVFYGTADYRNASANTTLYIGGTTNTYMWNGAIGNFQVHNRILTPAEVGQNFNNLKARYGL